MFAANGIFLTGTKKKYRFREINKIFSVRSFVLQHGNQFYCMAVLIKIRQSRCFFFKFNFLYGKYLELVVADFGSAFGKARFLSTGSADHLN